MKKILLCIIATMMLVFNGHANANVKSVLISNPQSEISAEVKLKFKESVDEARKFMIANPKATFLDFTRNFLNMRGFASKEAEAVFVKVYEFAKLPPKALLTWDYKELIVLATQIKSNLGDINSKTVLDITSLVSTGPYNPVNVTSKWPWKLILEILVGALEEIIKIL